MMLKYSLTTSKKGQTLIKIHHDFGDFKFYLTPEETKNKSFSWRAVPDIADARAGDRIATEAAKEIAGFTKNASQNISFNEMVASLKNAQRLNG